MLWFVLAHSLSNNVCDPLLTRQVVARTMTKQASWGNKLWFSHKPSQQENDFSRRSHVLIVDSSSGEIVSYVLSFGGVKGRSLPGQPPGKRISIDGKDFHSYHANHPSWIPDTYDISINIGYSPVSRQHKLSFDIARVSFGRGGCTPGQWNECPQVQINITGRYLGSGHHAFLPGGRYAVIDAYMKENTKFLLSSVECSNEGKVSVPLRLVDMKTQRNSVICEVKS